MTSSVDLVVLGRIASLAGETGFGWVEGVAIGDGRVVATGRRREIESLAGPRTRRLVLADGQLVLPAVTDAHLHLVDAALAADQLDLEGVPRLAEGLAAITGAHDARLAAGDADGWLLGHGWTFDAWHVRPSAADLERAAPGRPVALWAHDHHTRWLSQAALAALGIDRETPDPPGGRLGRLADGRPDGLLYEGAEQLAAGRIPRAAASNVAAAVERYARHLAALGVTGLHDPSTFSEVADDGLGGSGFDVLRAMAAAGRLPLRVHAGLREEQLAEALEAGLRSGQALAPPADADVRARRAVARFRVGWLKLFADGSLGSRTAALVEPYADAGSRPGPDGPSGALQATRDELAHRVAQAAAGGIGTMIHAIGDRAVSTTLDAFEVVGAARLGEAALAPRIEHAQVVRPSDRPRFAALGVVASMQPIQLRSDEPTMRRALGERSDLAFPARSLSAAGARLVFGTDAPVEPADPWPGVATAVTRWAPEWGVGVPPSAPQEALSLEAAIRAATVGPCLAAGAPIGGRLVPGAPADLVVLGLVLDDGPREAAEALRAVRPLLTLLDGDEVHRSADFDR